MPRFPGYGLPFQYYRPYPKNNYFNNYKPHTPPTSEPVIPQPQSKPQQNNTKISDSVWLDIFGIKLYFDDVLILSLLFFLYKEEVKDEGLFLALVLLLIS